MKINVIIAIIILMLSSAPSLSGDTMILTVEDCIEIGLEKNKLLHSSLMEKKLSEAQASEMSTYRFPELKLSGSYTRLSDIEQNAITLPPPISQTLEIFPVILDNYNFRLSVQQPIFSGLRIHSQYRSARFSARAANEDYRSAKSDLVYNIKQAYWSLYKTIEMKKVADGNVEVVEAHLKDVSNFFDQGLATNNEVLQVQVQFSNARLLQLNTEHARRMAMISLNSLIGIPLETELELAGSIEKEGNGLVRQGGFENLSLMIDRALHNRPELKAAAYREKAGEYGVKSARSGWFPQIYLNGNYYYSRPNSRIIPPEDRYEDTWDVSVMAIFDLWNWGRTVHQTKQAKARLAQIRDNAGLLEDQIALEVTRNYLEYTRARQEVIIAEQTVGQAEENHRIVNNKYRAGTALNSDLLDAEVALLQAKTSYTRAVVDLRLAAARLEKSIGE
jgi:outer membrane protein